MNNNDDKFYENIFGSDVTSKPVDSDSENAGNNAERLFDMNEGKPLIGIGDINENVAKRRKTIIGYILVGTLFMILGATRESFLFGLILMGIGAFVYYNIYDKIKTKCPQCKRLDAMELTYSADLFIDTDVKQYRVYQGTKHLYDETTVRKDKTSQDYERCKFCGHCRSVISKKQVY